MEAWAKGAFALRRASVRDFHSLRVTSVTLALTAGMPPELVQKVTGHKPEPVLTIDTPGGTPRPDCLIRLYWRMLSLKAS
jgi:hypothetical protein